MAGRGGWCSQVRASSELQFDALREGGGTREAGSGAVAARERQGPEHCRGDPGSALSGRYAPDSTKAEGSSIVDKPGED